MLLDFIYPEPPCYEVDDRPGVLKYVHYLYFSILLSVITLVVVVVVSLATNKPKPEQVKPLYQFLGFFCLFVFCHVVDLMNLRTSWLVDRKLFFGPLIQR